MVSNICFILRKLVINTTRIIFPSNLIQKFILFRETILDPEILKMKQTLKENTEAMKNMKHSLKKLSRQIEWISKYLTNEPATGLIQLYLQIFSHSINLQRIYRICII